MKGIIARLSQKCLTPLVMLVLIFTNTGHAFEVERFERMYTRHGLSQNNVQSIFCDHDGFLWAGTMNGLNRFDGYNFKVYKSDPNIVNTLTQNRVIKIFEDERKFLWLETNDRFYHYFIRATEEFISFPRYSKTVQESNSIISAFHQYDRDHIWLGSTRTGLYLLRYDEASNRYGYRQFMVPSQDHGPFAQINFICQQPSGDLFIGTNGTLFLVSARSIALGEPTFSTLLQGSNFNSFARTGHALWVGTSDKGIMMFDTLYNPTVIVPKLKDLKQITFLKTAKDETLLTIGTKTDGFYVFDLKKNHLHSYSTDRHEAQYIYEDRAGLIWMKSRKTGITKIDSETFKSKHFNLVPPNSNPLVDDEETLFFEDSKNNLWISNQGTGLGLYDRTKDTIRFYRYDQTKPGTLSSNHVLCMTEDQTGTLWVGTAHSNGGLNRMIYSSELFKHVLPETNFISENENLVRSLYCDTNGYIWAGTKAGTLHIFKPDFTHLAVYKNIDFKSDAVSGYNPYCITQDSKGNIWIGTKGGGISVTDRPLENNEQFYKNLKFHNYRFDPNNQQSLSSNNVYSIHEDANEQIWIGTFNGGVNRVLSRNRSTLVCQRYNESNHGLSTNLVRNILTDRDNNLWVATNFGVNVAPINADGNIDRFKMYQYDPDDSTGIKYNDVVHLYQDSRGWMWFATFGGGISLLQSYNPKKPTNFLHFSSKEGLVNDAVYAIQEDLSGNMWFSTEKGISKLDPRTFKIENFGKNIGIVYENFCENTTTLTKEGKILFGNLNGLYIIEPSKVTLSDFIPKVKLIRFMVNNRDVDFHDPQSPLNEVIEETKHIQLEHYQANFSIEFAALDFRSPESVRYQYRLDPFDKDWSAPDDNRMATYTNLNPGTYTFRVKSTNSDGVWNNAETQLTVEILPPYWQTWWFRSMVIVTFILILFLFYHQRERNFKRSREILKQKVEERTHEITLQKEQIEEQKNQLDAANKLKDRFFSIIAHDLINPVNAVNQLSEQLAINYSEFSQDERLNFISHINKSGKNVQSLLEELLIWARAQTNRIDYQYNYFDLKNIIQQAIEAVEFVAGNKNILIKNGINKEIMVYCDEFTVSTIIRNLLINAIKFSYPNSYIEIGHKPSGDWMHLFVRDFGMGMSDETKNKLFTIGEKFSNRGTDGEQGTGLGLYICYEFVKGNGGKIWFESEKEKGSVFWFSLPTNKEAFSSATKK